MTVRKPVARKILVSIFALFLGFALLAPVTAFSEERKAIEPKPVDGVVFDAASNAGHKVIESFSPDNAATVALGVAAIGAAYAAAPEVMIIGAAMGAAATAGILIYEKKNHAPETKAK